LRENARALAPAPSAADSMSVITFQFHKGEQKWTYRKNDGTDSQRPGTGIGLGYFARDLAARGRACNDHRPPPRGAKTTRFAGVTNMYTGRAMDVRAAKTTWWPRFAAAVKGPNARSDLHPQRRYFADGKACIRTDMEFSGVNIDGSHQY